MDVKTYKKTATIDAVQWDGTVNSTTEIVVWAAEYGVEIGWLREYNPLDSRLLIPTLEGPMYASVGDYIAKGVQNEFWPIKPDIMDKTYEEI